VGGMVKAAKRWGSHKPEKNSNHQISLLYYLKTEHFIYVSMSVLRNATGIHKQQRRRNYSSA
jgi:hypothetical protein